MTEEEFQSKSNVEIYNEMPDDTPAQRTAKINFLYDVLLDKKE